MIENFWNRMKGGAQFKLSSDKSIETSNNQWIQFADLTAKISVDRWLWT